MNRIPDISGETMVKALKKEGFIIKRQRGSHVLMEKVTPLKTYITTVPAHRSLKKGLISDIVDQAGITRDRLLELLQQK